MPVGDGLNDILTSMVASSTVKEAHSGNSIREFSNSNKSEGKLAPPLVLL